MNIIFVTKADLYTGSINLIKNNLITKIVFSIIIIVILGSIVLLITLYLIKSIAVNILRPIKMMNSILLGINKENNEKEHQSIVELKKVKSRRQCSLEFRYGKQNKNHIKNYKSYETLNKYEDEDEDDEYENENDDDLLDIRSEDIDNLFQTLVDLKRTLQYVQTNTDNENKFLDLLFAKNTLINVNSIQARLLCNSNLGNLAIKFKKYDKAIVHLWQSLKLSERNINNENDFFNEFMEDLHKVDLENNYTFDVNYLGCYETQEKHENTKTFALRGIEIEMENKVNLESRIPKLIFAFKKFFKNLKKILKVMLKDSKFDKILENLDASYNNSINYMSLNEVYLVYREKLIPYFLNNDIYTWRKLHNFTNFKKVIDQYISQSIETKNSRLQILAEFELIDFVIKYILVPLEYKLKITIRIHYSSPIANNYINDSKYSFFNKFIGTLETKIKELREKLKNKFDEVYKKILLDNKDSTEKYLISKKLSKKNYLEYSDIPKSVLLQRINFLNSKFNFNYDLKESFYKLNSITRFQDDVIDGIVLISSYKKIIKILNLIVTKLENLNLSENTTKLNFIVKNFANLNLNQLFSIKITGNNTANVLNTNIVNTNLSYNNSNFYSKSFDELCKLNTTTMITFRNINDEIYKIVKNAFTDFIRLIREKSELCIKAYNEEISKYSDMQKDIAVLLDFSENLLEKDKKEKSEKFFEFIFENICTFNDRISLFGYNNTTFQLLTLMFKNSNTIKFIENHYKSIWKNLDENFYNEKEVQSELIKAIGYVYNNIGRKDIYNKREKWIIVLTDSISDIDLKVFSDKKNFWDKIYGSKKNENLIIVRFKFSDDNIENKIMEDAMKFNKSCYIELEKKHYIKTCMRIEGVINERTVFDNEIYNP